MPNTTETTTEKVKRTPKIKVPEIPPPEGAKNTNYGENTNTQSIPKMVKFTHEIVVGLVVVLFIGFAGMFVAVSTMLWDSWNNKSSNYEILKNKVEEQNYKIDLLLQKKK